MAQYTIDQNTEVRETSSTSVIPVGINDDVKLIAVTKETATNNSPYLQFLFRSTDGSELKHIEWDIDPERISPKPGETQDEAVQRRTNMMLVRVKHICTKFVDESKFVLNAQNFDELCEGIITIMAAKSDTTVRLKVTYNWKDYASLPGFPPFIEEQSNGETKLKINKQYDKMEKSGAAAEAEVAESDESGLPF